MARDLKQLTVFISGTDEADAEKAALRRVVDELNKRLEKTHSVTIRVVGWPDDVRPGVNTDLQAEINRQFGSTFDIYVGLLGTRFGTPTPRAGSGTEEEFEDALARFQSDSRSMRVLFYFKRATEDPFAMDLGQLQKVRRFRETITSRGVLYRDFRDTAEFIGLVQDHLYNLVVDEWQGQHWSPVLPADYRPSRGAEDGAPAAQSQDESAVPISISGPGGLAEGKAPDLPISPSPDEDEEPGFLEYMEGFHEAANVLSEVMTQILRNTERVNEQIRARTAETEALQQQHGVVRHVGGSRSQQEFVARARENVDRAAGDLDEFVSAMTPSVEQYRLHSRLMFAQLRNARKAGSEFETGNTDEDREALKQLINVLQTSRESTGTFQASISQVPALSGRFKRARKRTAAVLGELIAEMSITIDEAKRLLDDPGAQPTGGR